VSLLVSPQKMGLSVFGGASLVAIDLSTTANVTVVRDICCPDFEVR
jgi:hypothetical protein